MKLIAAILVFAAIAFGDDAASVRNQIDKLNTQNAARAASSKKTADEQHAETTQAIQVSAADSQEQARTNADKADASAKTNVATQARLAVKVADLDKPLWFTFGTGVLSVLTVMFGWLKIRALHSSIAQLKIEIDGNLKMLLELTAKEALARGVLQEKERPKTDDKIHIVRAD
jgi:hypothetical protein